MDGDAESDQAAKPAPGLHPAAPTRCKKILQRSRQQHPIACSFPYDNLEPMQAISFLDEASLNTGAPDQNPSLRVVIAYDDVAAGKRAMRVLTNIAASTDAPIEFEPMPWPFNLLEDVDWYRVAASDVVKADILIIASSAKVGPLPSAVGRWTEAAIRQKQGTSAAVVALFGPENYPDDETSPRVDSLRSAAAEAGLAFFTPVHRRELVSTLAEIHRRAETMDPGPCGPALSPRRTSRPIERIAMNRWKSGPALKLLAMPEAISTGITLPELQDSFAADSGKRILYADDDGALRLVTELMLRRFGFALDTAKDGREALRKLREEPYDLVITDLHMPGLNGLELARQVHLAGMGIPVILVSGTVDDLPAESAGRMGLAAVLAKPFAAEELTAAIHQALHSPASQLSPPVLPPPLGAEFVPTPRPDRWGINE